MENARPQLVRLAAPFAIQMDTFVLALCRRLGAQRELLMALEAGSEEGSRSCWLHGLLACGLQVPWGLLPRPARQRRGSAGVSSEDMVLGNTLSCKLHCSSSPAAGAGAHQQLGCLAAKRCQVSDAGLASHWLSPLCRACLGWNVPLSSRPHLRTERCAQQGPRHPLTFLDTASSFHGAE